MEPKKLDQNDQDLSIMLSRCPPKGITRDDLPDSDDEYVLNLDEIA